MEKFKYAVHVDDDPRDFFSFASYDLRKKETELTADDYLPIKMTVKNCRSYDSCQTVDILGLVTFYGGDDDAIVENFRNHYVNALRGKDTEWILVGGDKNDINLVLTYYNHTLHKQQSLKLDVRSRGIEQLKLGFQMPHRNGLPDITYEWVIDRLYSNDDCTLEVTNVHKRSPFVERYISYAEGDDIISITEYNLM